MSRKKKLLVEYEYEKTPDSKEKLQEIFEFLFSNDSGNSGDTIHNSIIKYCVPRINVQNWNIKFKVAICDLKRLSKRI